MNIELSTEQLKIIKKANDYNIVVDCVVGSGKTRTILEIAKSFLSDSVQKRVLILMYNTRLRKESEFQFSNKKSVEIHTYHSFCYKYNSFQRKVINDHGISDLIRDYDKNIDFFRNEPFDTIIIDEGQDINQLYYELVCIIINENNKKLNGIRTKLCLFGDTNQTIYKYNGADNRYLNYASDLFNFNNFRWVSLKLNETFRLTKPICSFVMYCSYEKNISMFSNKESDKKPRYIICNHFSNRPFEEIKYYLKDYLPSEILVLSPSLKNMKDIINKVSNSGVPVFCSTGNEILDPSINKLIFCTFHQAKGLERKVVIVFNFDFSYFKYYNKTADKNECTNELYVEITRSSERLSLIHHYKYNFLPMVSKNSRGVNYAKLILNRLCDIEYPKISGKYLTFENIYSIKNSDSEEEKQIRVSVSDALKHISIKLIDKLMSYVKINKIMFEDSDMEKLKVSKVTTGSTNFEFVADITGIAIPMNFEYYKTGNCTIKNLVDQKIYKKYTIPENVPSFIKKTSFENIKSNIFLKDSDEECSSEESKSEESELEESESESESEEFDDRDDSINILKYASRWNSISNGTTHKINQISEYNWISEEIFNKCNQRMDKHISSNAVFEEFYSKNYEKTFYKDDYSYNINVLGYIDCIDVKDGIKNLWEFKCTENLDSIHFLQTVLYIFISGNYEGNNYLFNIFTNEIYKIEITEFDMKMFLYTLFKNKYFTNQKIYSDEEFISKNINLIEYLMND